jgi:hypothetical protein
VRRCKMKLMYFLMDRDEQREKRLELEFEVGRSVRPSVGLLQTDRARAPCMDGRRRCSVGNGGLSDGLKGCARRCRSWRRCWRRSSGWGGSSSARCRGASSAIAASPRSFPPM